MLENVYEYIIDNYVGSFREVSSEVKLVILDTNIFQCQYLDKEDLIPLGNKDTVRLGLYEVFLEFATKPDWNREFIDFFLDNIDYIVFQGFPIYDMNLFHQVIKYKKSGNENKLDKEHIIKYVLENKEKLREEKEKLKKYLLESVFKIGMHYIFTILYEYLFYKKDSKIKVDKKTADIYQKNITDSINNEVINIAELNIKIDKLILEIENVFFKNNKSLKISKMLSDIEKEKERFENCHFKERYIHWTTIKTTKDEVCLEAQSRFINTIVFIITDKIKNKKIEENDILDMAIFYSFLDKEKIFYNSKSHKTIILTKDNKLKDIIENYKKVEEYLKQLDTLPDVTVEELYPSFKK